MQAGKAIGLVATFVVGVVLVMGAALIYFVAKEPREEHAPISQRLPEPSRLPTPPTHPPAFAETENAATPASSTVAMQASEFEAYSPAAASSYPQHTTGYHSSSIPRSPSSTSALPATVASSGVPAGVEPPTIDPDGLQHSANTQENKALALAAQPHKVTLPAGTGLTVKLMQPLSTDEAKQGQFFQTTLAAPIIRDGFVLAETGSAITGEVVRSKRAGLFGHAPDLRLMLLDIRTADNQIARIQTNFWDYTGRSHNVVAGTFRSAMGAVKGAVQGAARGSGIVSQEKGVVISDRAVFVPANTILEFRLVAPVSLTERLQQ